MWYVRTEPNPSGAYSAPQSKPFPDCAVMTDEQMQTLVEYNGFVVLTFEALDGVLTVTAIEPDLEAWEAWKSAQPEPTAPEPTQLDRIEAQTMYTALMTDTLLEEDV